MGREFIIWMDFTEWEIRAVGLDDYSSLKYIETGLNFAHCNASGDEILYIHDINLIDLEKAEKEPRFLGEYVFYINEANFLKNTPQDKNRKFQGSFYDALKYINENFKG